MNIYTLQAEWKPRSKKWSLLYVNNHLFDEEREGFRLQLNRPGEH